VAGVLAVVTAKVTDQTVMSGETHMLSDGMTITVEAFQIKDAGGAGIPRKPGR